MKILKNLLFTLFVVLTLNIIIPVISLATGENENNEENVSENEINEQINIADDKEKSNFDKEKLQIDIEYVYDEKDNTVTAIIHSNVELANTKPTWTLSEDKKSYSKIYVENMVYTTDVIDIYGNQESVQIEINKIDDKGPKIEVKYIYNEKDNTVTVVMYSDELLGDTKPTWTLSEDRKSYTKVYAENTNYITQVEDIYGNQSDVQIQVNQIKNKELQIEMEYTYDKKNNTVIAIMHSNVELADTKPTWTLSEDRRTYTKVYAENTNYITQVEDIYGNQLDVQIQVNQIENKELQIEVEYKYDEKDNIVTAIIHSNVELADTKPSWTLSEDRKSYSKIYIENMDYTTDVEDIYGNKANVQIQINQIDIQGPRTEVEYIYDNKTNIVTVVIHSNEILADTKPSWTLSEDRKSYSKIYVENIQYETEVVDLYGNKSRVEIKVNQIDKTAPKISVNYVYNPDNTITVTMTSNEILADTKPTWTLSEDRKSYSKIYIENIDYNTSVQDIYGNECSVKIKIKTKLYTYPNNGGQDITVKYLYDSNEVVTVYIVSDIPFKDTKLTWTLSDDKKTYTKKYIENNIYVTTAEDINGNKFDVNIIVNFFDKDTYRGIDVSYYQKAINWIGVSSSGIDFKSGKKLFSFKSGTFSKVTCPSVAPDQ